MAINLVDVYNISRNSVLPSGTAFSMMAWVKYTGTPAAREGFLFFYSAGVRSTYGARTLEYINLAGSDTGSTPSVGDWFHLAFVVNGTGTNAVTGYYNGEVDGQTNGDAGSTSAMIVGGDGYHADSYGNADLTAIRFYDAVLTQDEIRAEMRSIRPARWSGLKAWLPWRTTDEFLLDYSGNGSFTPDSAGNQVTHDGPPVLWGASEQLGQAERNVSRRSELVLPPGAVR